jgi:hypothetical protein
VSEGPTKGKETEMTELTPVQAVRWEARNHGRAARDLLTGVVGLPQGEQVDRLLRAKEEYEAAAEALVKGLQVLVDRDPAEYQATKHQGAEGWTFHVTTVHGVEVEALQALAAEFLYAPDAVAEAAYQWHKTLDDHDHGKEV